MLPKISREDLGPALHTALRKLGQEPETHYAWCGIGYIVAAENEVWSEYLDDIWREITKLLKDIPEDEDGDMDDDVAEKVTKAIKEVTMKTLGSNSWRGYKIPLRRQSHYMYSVLSYAFSNFEEHDWEAYAGFVTNPW